MGKRGNFITPDTKAFVLEAFDYLTILEKCSINHSANRGLLEQVANGYVKYGNSDNFIKHIHEWLKTETKIYREIYFDTETNKIFEVIDTKVVGTVETNKEDLEVTIEESKVLENY